MKVMVVGLDDPTCDLHVTCVALPFPHITYSVFGSFALGSPNLLQCWPHTLRLCCINCVSVSPVNIGPSQFGQHQGVQLATGASSDLSTYGFPVCF